MPMQVFQLQARGKDTFGCERTITIYNTVVFATYKLAEKRIEKFREAVVDRIIQPVVFIVPMDVITDETNELPASYTPSIYGPPAVEKRNEIVYAAGYEEKPGSFGMYDGPTPSLQEILESIPCGVNPCIIRFNLDGSEQVLYRWDDDDRSWKLQ
ncbi:MAG: hypothetical protein WC919_03155 [Candidatus Paceibacterota bacterium]|jgi:hypothetical protein